MHPDMVENNPKSKIRVQIDENLRRIYDETLNEDIPDKLTKLLEQLRQKSSTLLDGNAPEGRNDEPGE
jgi:Anti-sigma factor NepR